MDHPLTPQSHVDPADPAEPCAPTRHAVAAREGTSRMSPAAALPVLAGVLGALPVAWVVGAVPWRTPTLRIEHMFRGFTACALEAGSLTPWRMVCERAGVPLGMYQLDAGLSYPLGGLFVRLGLDPLPAWKLTVALLLVPGFAVLFWLGRRLTGSVLGATLLTVLFGLSGALTARTWTWYWNSLAITLLPLVFAGAFVVLDRARQRRPGLLAAPAAGMVVSVVAIGIEWSYAGLFAAAVAGGTLLLVVTQPGWTASARLRLIASGAVGLAVVLAVTRWRLDIAGVQGQFSLSVNTALGYSIDVAALLLPDSATSLTGRVLDAVGLDGLLVRRFSEGSQLYVAPYLATATACVIVPALVVGRIRPPGNERCPPRYLTLLLGVTVVSALLSLGPRWSLAGVAAPGASVTSPVAWLWTATPVEWIRYPWTLSHLTQLALLLAIAAVAPALVRGGRRGIAVAWIAAVVVVLDFASPGVAGALLSSAPSVATAPTKHVISSDHPAAERFETIAIPELHRALQRAGGVATLLPWRNLYHAPRLGPEVGVRLRNVGIDRNVRVVEKLAPVHQGRMRRPSAQIVRRLLDTRYTDVVVLLDHDTGGRGVLVGSQDPPPRRAAAWQRRSSAIQQRLRQWGYCVERHSWFALVRRCAG